jgi:hypothetical protein
MCSLRHKGDIRVMGQASEIKTLSGRWLIVVVLLSAMAVGLWAQSTFGSIVGTVQDARADA